MTNVVPKANFPCMFGDRKPQFVPRSIDPKQPLPTYPAWCTGPKSSPSKPINPVWILAGLIIVAAGIWLWWFA
jgi:hypothetical protein